MKGKNEEEEKSEPVEMICLKCQQTEIVYLPREDVPKCPHCQKRMTIRELLMEGKSY